MASTPQQQQLAVPDSIPVYETVELRLRRCWSPTTGHVCSKMIQAFRHSTTVTCDWGHASQYNRAVSSQQEQVGC